MKKPTIKSEATAATKSKGRSLYESIPNRRTKWEALTDAARRLYEAQAP